MIWTINKEDDLRVTSLQVLEEKWIQDKRNSCENGSGGRKKCSGYSEEEWTIDINTASAKKWSKKGKKKTMLRTETMTRKLLLIVSHM